MAIHHLQPGRLTHPQLSNLQVTVVPAPTKGVDARVPVGNMPPDVCIFTYNLMPAEYGMLLRNGFREWCIDLDNGASQGVFTIIPFTGTAAGAIDDRLFAVTNEGIWDVTTYDTPSFDYTFTENSFGAGHGVFCHYIDQATNDFLLYADQLNGLIEYDTATETWAQSAGINGPVIGNVAFCVVHKQRLWLVESESTSAWYLPIASKQGDATEFFFGSKFPHGGHLVGLFNWTVDGGLGIDDFLVAVSSSGDVVVYQGEDPSSATSWSVRGTYFIGAIPEGRRIASEYSGDLYFLSSFGLISMSDLIRGVDSQNPSATSLSFRVARPLRDQLSRKISELGWEPIFLPSQGQLFITIPKANDNTDISYVMNLATEGWGFWRGVPAQCLTDFLGDVHFGTLDNKVYIMDVTRDYVTIEEPVDGTNGEPIEFSLMSSYTNLDAAAQFKMVNMVRPNFYTFSQPIFRTKVVYDYSFQEAEQPPAAPLLDPDGWDLGLWDLAIWETTEGGGFNELRGTSGIGRSAAIALRGSAGNEVRLVSWDVMWKTGGPI